MCLEWPDEVYVPQPREFCKWAGRRGFQRCSSSWILDSELPMSKVASLWHQAATEAGIIRPTQARYSIPARNDHRLTTTKQLALAFERMLELAGYEIVEE